MTELTIYINPELWEKVQQMGGFKNQIALTNEAITFLKWALEKTADNKIVGWVDEQKGDYAALSVDWIEYAKSKLDAKNAPGIEPAREPLAKLIKRVNAPEATEAVTIKMNKARETAINKLISLGGFDSAQAAINEAVRGLSWALGQAYQGRIIAAIDEATKRYHRLDMPCLDYVATHRPQIVPSKSALKPPEGGDDISWSEWLDNIRKRPPATDKENER